LGRNEDRKIFVSFSLPENRKERRKRQRKFVEPEKVQARRRQCFPCKTWTHPDMGKCAVAD
jgi:hypothetical protein